MKKLYKIAGIEFEINIPEEHCYDREGVMEEFLEKDIDVPHKFDFKIVENLDCAEGELLVDESGLKVYATEHMQQRYIGSVQQGWNRAYIRAVHCGNKHCVQVKREECRESIGVKTVLNSIAMEHLVIEKKGVILHASFIEHQGKAILFTAPSETGKSTQADLWVEHRNAEIINGDRAVIRLIDGKAYACGIPFAGSSNYCKNKTLPLAAIVYLGQAPEISIEKLGVVEGFKRVWEGCTVNTWNQEDVNSALDIVSEIISKVPVYHLECTPDESAVIALERKLKEKEDEK